VLQHNIVYTFENTTTGFLEHSFQAITNFGLKSEIIYTINKDANNGEKLRGPFISCENNQIHIQETFLAYLWCMCYSLSIFTDKLVSSSSVSQLKEDKAKKLFSYALSLKSLYMDWDKSQLVNPECYCEEDAIDVENTNELFLNAFNFILCHEFAHVALGHNVKPSNLLTLEEKKEYETQADKKSIELFLENEKVSKNYGIILALCASIFLSDRVSRKIHPDSDTRMQNALDQIQVDDNDTCWLIACASFGLWSNYFNIDIDWTENNTFKALFNYISIQLE
jgi:hypothetical protein